MAEGLARAMCDANYNVAAWSMTTPAVRAIHLNIARKLIELGWAKAVRDE